MFYDKVDINQYCGSEGAGGRRDREGALRVPWQDGHFYFWKWPGKWGTITVCPSLNTTNRHVGGASIFSKFHS